MVYMVGTIRNEDNSIKEFILYKFYENSTHRIDYEGLYNGIKRGRIKVDNLMIQDDEIVCTEGNIDNYTIYNDKMQVLGDLKLVILGSNAYSSRGDFFAYGYIDGLKILDHISIFKYKGYVANGEIDFDSGSIDVYNKNVIYSRSRIIDNRVRKYIAKMKLMGKVEVVLLSHTHGINLYRVEKLETDDFVIPDFVNKISSRCFSYGLLGEKLIVPDSVISAEPYSIANTSFKKIEFGNGITDLKSVMDNNRNLEELILPNTITYIPSHLATGSFKLKSLYIPDSVETIYSDAFYHTGIETLYISKNNTYFKDKREINGIKVQII